MWTVRSPSASRSVAARNARPMSLCISWDLPLIRPASLSRGVLVLVARGSMEYSAVTQPFPWPRRKAGTRSSREAAHSTLVAPISMSAEPSANFW